MVNAAAVEVALGWLVGAVVRTLLFSEVAAIQGFLGQH